MHKGSSSQFHIVIPSLLPGHSSKMAASYSSITLYPCHLAVTITEWFVTFLLHCSYWPRLDCQHPIPPTIQSNRIPCHPAYLTRPYSPILSTLKSKTQAASSSKMVICTSKTALFHNQETTFCTPMTMNTCNTFILCIFVQLIHQPTEHLVKYNS